MTIYYQEGDKKLKVTAEAYKYVVRVTCESWRGQYGYKACRIRVLKLPIDDPLDDHNRPLYYANGQTYISGVKGARTPILKVNSKNVIGVAYDSGRIPKPRLHNKQKGAFHKALTIAEKIAGLPLTYKRCKC